MSILKRLKELYSIIHESNKVHYDVRNPKFLLAKLLIEQNSRKTEIKSIQDVEFRVFSQWGDDGIIQYLLSKLAIPSKTFVEFGVEQYTESNTRFLLMNNNWKGLVIDGSAGNINYIKRDAIYWQYELHAIEAFITAENIESLIDRAGFEKQIGLLSIDIDGNDYTVWKAIRKYDPAIVIVEYNAAFGDEMPWITPYDPAFVRKKTGPEKLFWGASLQSLCDLAEEKGYDFIGCNLNGNNAYFIRKTINKNLFRPLTCKEGFVEAMYREAFDGEQPICAKDKMKYLRGMQVFNTRKNAVETI